MSPRDGGHGGTEARGHGKKGDTIENKNATSSPVDDRLYYKDTDLKIGENFLWDSIL